MTLVENLILKKLGIKILILKRNLDYDVVDDKKGHIGDELEVLYIHIILGICEVLWIVRKYLFISLILFILIFYVWVI